MRAPPEKTRLSAAASLVVRHGPEDGGQAPDKRGRLGCPSFRSVALFRACNLLEETNNGDILCERKGRGYIYTPTHQGRGEQFK